MERLEQHETQVIQARFILEHGRQVGIFKYTSKELHSRERIMPTPYTLTIGYEC